MTQHGNRQHLQSFEGRKVRTVWDDAAQEFYFSVADVIAVLTDSADVKQYIKKMRARDPELGSRWGTICTPTRMMASDGKYYNTQAANMEGIFRIIQSIPSPKAEPFKLWMSQVAANRVNQMIDPELSIDQAMNDYRRLGYSESWINQRLKTIEIRKGLTDEWKRGGITEAIDFATLTDLMSKTWSGFTTREYKQYKGLTKENLRDNMTNMELVLNMLAETSSTEISKSKKEKGFKEAQDSVIEGGNIARVAKEQLERKTGKKIISNNNAKEIRKLNS